MKMIAILPYLRMFILCWLGGWSFIQAQSNQIPSSGNSIKDFVPKGWEIFRSDSADFNDDGYLDELVCIEETATKGEMTFDHYVRTVLILFRKGNGWELNTQHPKYLGCDACGGSCGDPFSGMLVNDKTNTFTLMEYVCGDGYSFLNQVFQYTNGDWFLIGEHSGGCPPDELCNDKKAKKEGCGSEESINYMSGLKISKGWDNSCKYYSRKEKLEKKPLQKFTDIIN